MPSPPHHKQYNIAIRSANGHTTTHNISATLPQAVLWARAIGSGCLLPARATIISLLIATALNIAIILITH